MSKPVTNSPLLWDYANKKKPLKAWLDNKAYRSKNHDGGGKIKKPQVFSFTCSSVKGICQAKVHPRIGCAVHGSLEEAMKCTARSAAILASGEIQ